MPESGTRCGERGGAGRGLWSRGRRGPGQRAAGWPGASNSLTVGSSAQVCTTRAKHFFASPLLLLSRCHPARPPPPEDSGRRRAARGGRASPGYGRLRQATAAQDTMICHCHSGRVISQGPLRAACCKEIMLALSSLGIPPEEST